MDQSGLVLIGPRHVPLCGRTNIVVVVVVVVLNVGSCHMQLSAMMVAEAIFLCSQRWLQENNNVPIEVRSARFILARATTGKLAALLIDYRFPRRPD